ncbi:MAG: hypothetical protein Q8S73_24790 [Deltaproteobacteria bacterium]|nr:hypothetical protein [Myxococcales bacterium]MDP3217352.1 hypothetical protein [Deltaproteobacteria bacterium]
MTTVANPTARTPELAAIARDVKAALEEGRFDEVFYHATRQRVADARGDFGDEYYVIQAAVKAGVIPSTSHALGPGAPPRVIIRWSDAAGAFVRETP